MVIHAFLVGIVVKTDLRLEELGDCSQKYCMKKMKLFIAYPLSDAVGIHE